MKNDTVNISALTLKEFLDNNCLTAEQFEKADFSWEELLEIGSAHYDNIPALSETAGLISSILQQGEDVHSVRWRIKDPEHLMAKIIRKRNEDEISEKYRTITKDNYTDVITDLIGIRVLHLFKEDWEKIHNYLDSKWEFQESPIVYIREGDAPDINIEGSVEKTHPAGYRSVHYIISTRLLKNRIYTEIQVRTIFEEAWSEIDHRVRYPNFKSNEILNYFLLIFNRFAGSADEMGTFVLSLKNELKESIERGIKISEIEKEKETYLAKIDELVSNLEADQKITVQTKNELKQVKAKLDYFQKKEDALYRKSLFERLNIDGSLGSIQDLSSKSNGLFGNLENKTSRNKTSRGLIDSLTNSNEALRKMKISIEDLNLDGDGMPRKPPKK
ncbi:RelA/SpoT domain-containing protein [Enterobacter cloacae]|uniref:RelA/SpoT domain-containing protein n=1 Tax=Enterobacter cloacae TaxID=550 RepID=UPI00203753DA|nr:RelA/SpoT domain-containing protein [Enterobacter cloacae]MCM2489679.1 RelA/SpoT domain-containing protein [Enterobacter cloacae]